MVQIPSILRSILNNSEAISQFNVLSVGCGDGAEDIKVLKIIHEELNNHPKYKNIKISMTAIEPNPLYCDAYKQAIKQLPGVIEERSSFDVRLMTFDDYTKEKIQQAFDMVLFIHSLYYMDIEESLRYCLDKMLNDRGQVVALLDESGVLFSVDFNDEDEDDCSPCEQVFKAVTQNNWRLTDFKGEYGLDCTTACENVSTEGNLLLDFLMQQIDFRVTAEKEQVEFVEKVLKESVELRDGKKIGKVHDRLFVISKS